MTNIGIVILIVLLVPTFFQAVIMNVRQERGRREIIEKLDFLEQLLKKLEKESHPDNLGNHTKKSES